MRAQELVQNRSGQFDSTYMVGHLILLDGLLIMLMSVKLTKNFS